ncbi:Rap1a/Tai family immunity protein [Aeromonas jandaei]
MNVKYPIATTLILFSLNSAGEFSVGNDLYSICSTKKGDEFYYMNSSECRGYITGVSDALSGYTFCIPSGVTVGQDVDIVMRYLSEHPESRHINAAELIARALYESFPCKSKK